MKITTTVRQKQSAINTLKIELKTAMAMESVLIMNECYPSRAIPEREAKLIKILAEIKNIANTITYLEFKLNKIKKYQPHKLQTSHQ
jgi:hypothetical protein